MKGITILICIMCALINMTWFTTGICLVGQIIAGAGVIFCLGLAIKVLLDK